MKKLLSLMLAAALICSFSAFMSGCSARDDEVSSQTAESKPDESSSELIVDEQPVEDGEDEQPIESEAPGEAAENLVPSSGKEHDVGEDTSTEGASLSNEVNPQPEQPPEHPEAVNEASQVDEAVQVEMYTEQGQYPLDTEAVKVMINNKGNQKLGYDAYYSLEVLQGENWQEVTADAELTIEDLAGILSPGKETSQMIDLAPYAELQAGQYRIVKKVNEQVLYAPFELI